MPFGIDEPGFFVQGIDPFRHSGTENPLFHEAFHEGFSPEISETDGGDDGGELVLVRFHVNGIVGVYGSAAHGDVNGNIRAVRYLVEPRLHGQLERAGRIEQQVDIAGRKGNLVVGVMSDGEHPVL